MDAGSTIDLIFFNFSKAFDVIIYNSLFAKLQFWGISDNLLLFIQSFLTNHTMRAAEQDQVN